eukprot:847597-Prorocentrum_minimum.AAC.2
MTRMRRRRRMITRRPFEGYVMFDKSSAARFQQGLMQMLNKEVNDHIGEMLIPQKHSDVAKLLVGLDGVCHKLGSGPTRYTHVLHRAPVHYLWSATCVIRYLLHEAGHAHTYSVAHPSTTYDPLLAWSATCSTKLGTHTHTPPCTRPLLVVRFLRGPLLAPRSWARTHILRHAPVHYLWSATCSTKLSTHTHNPPCTRPPRSAARPEP